MSRINIAALAGLAFLGCTQPGSIDLDTLDIRQAVALMIRTESSGNARLHKITEQGSVVDVAAYDRTGQDVTAALEPTSVAPGGSDFAIVFGRIPGSSVNSVLVRRSDGAAFSLEGVGEVADFRVVWFANTPLVQQDDAGNLYFPVHMDNQLRVVQVSVADPDSLLVTPKSAVLDYVTGFLVSKEGHVIYRYDSNVWVATRVWKATGGLYNLSAAFVWIARDGAIRYFRYNEAGGEPAVFVGTLSIDPQGEVTTQEDPTVLDSAPAHDGLLVVQADRTYVVSRGSLIFSGPWLWEIEGPDGVQPYVSGPEPLWSWEAHDLVLQEGVLFVYATAMGGGDGTIFVVSIPDLEVRPIFNDPGYELRAIEGTRGDRVGFVALRLSDGAAVTGEVDATGTWTILSVDSGGTEIYLQRL